MVPAGSDAPAGRRAIQDPNGGRDHGLIAFPHTGLADAKGRRDRSVRRGAAGGGGARPTYEESSSKWKARGSSCGERYHVGRYDTDKGAVDALRAAKERRKAWIPGPFKNEIKN